MNNTGKSPLRRRVLFLGLVFMPVLAVANMRGATRADVLEAIHCVENPRDTLRVGKHGELGAYQFRRGTWSMHSPLPFTRALERGESEKVAIEHYEWLRRGLERNGVAATPYNIALAWNAGLATTVRGRANAAAQDYAQRVTNLTREFQTMRLATVP